MPPQYAEALRWHIEHSPFSEDVIVHVSEAWFIDGGNAGTLEWETIFDGADAKTPPGEYQYLPGGEGEGETLVLRGIFDESVERDEGSKATRRKPRAAVSAWPKMAQAGTRVTIRGKEYAVTSYEADANLGMVVWLR
jgi:hypothetical protein